MRTGSDGARLHVEGVRARVMTTAAAAAKAKFGTTEAEFNAVAELLGTDADDDDFCPTCLEVYTNGEHPSAQQHGSTQGMSRRSGSARAPCVQQQAYVVPTCQGSTGRPAAGAATTCASRSAAR